MKTEQTPRKGAHSSVVSSAFAALAAALIAVGAWITVPAAVPFTMQTFAVFCALLLLGGRYGTMAVGVYLLLGAVGVPVFSGFRGGVGVLFSATGGYLLGFLLMALVYWAVTALLGEGLWQRVTALVGGQVLCYAFGTWWFALVYTQEHGAVGAATALGMGVLPFLLPDAVKLVLALVVTARVKKRMKF